MNFQSIKSNPNIPTQFTSVQVEKDDTIFLVGGVLNTEDSRDFIVSNDVRSIDGHLNVQERAPLKTPRCSIPLALVHDRVIMAIGGMTGRT